MISRGETFNMSIPNLKVNFPDAFNKLIELFKYNRIERLNEIYIATEEKWELNIKRIVKSGAKIKYVLIGEAAPFSLGEVQYFYNEKLESRWRRIVCKAFAGDGNPHLPELELQMLAERGFILIDVLPFVEEYKPTYRSHRRYRDMIRLCSDCYFYKKLNDPRLQWEPEIKIAFGVLNTCRAVSDVYNNSICFPNGQTISITEELTAINRSNYPDSKVLKGIFKLY